MGSTFYALAELLRSKPLIALLALLTHYVLNIGEWDNKFHLVLITWVTAFGGTVALEYAADPEVNSVGTAIRITMTLAATYFSVLLTSMLLHRGFFHRLRKVRKFPPLPPLSCASSPRCHVSQAFSRFSSH